MSRIWVPNDYRQLLLLLLILLQNPGEVRAQENWDLSNRTLRIGAVITYYPEERRNDGWGYENTGSAIHLAVEKFQAAGGLIGGMRIQIYRVDDGCVMKRAIHEVFKLHSSFKPDIVMGPSCSAIIAVIGYLMSYWNLPYWPYGGTEPALEDKKKQNVMVRIHATGSKVGVAFTHLCNMYNWRRVVMITSVRYCDMGARGVYNEFIKQGIQVADWVKTLSASIDNAVLDSFLERLRVRGRIFIVCFDDWDSHQRFFERAEAKGMTTPEYVYLFYSIRGPVNDRVYKPWQFGRQLTEGQAQQKKRPYFFYKQVTLTTLSGPDIEDFYNQIPERLAQAPIYYNQSLINGWKGSWQAVNLHDLTLTYLALVNEMIISGEDYRNGTLVTQKMINRRVEGPQLQSPLLYDQNADRVPNFWFWSLSPVQDKFEIGIEMVMTDPPDKRMHVKGAVYWGTEDGNPPPDVPVCGFRGEFCTVDEENNSTTLIVSTSVAAAVVLLFIIAISWLARRRSRESSLRQMTWKINYAEIDMPKSRRNGSKSTESTGSIHSQTKSGRASRQGGGGQSLSTQGVYKSSNVTVHVVNKQNVVLQRRLLVELKTDILENDSIKLDWTFKLSLISDLANGMAYLHRSELHSHGNLTSGNCLVDNRWTLKVSEYGLKSLKEGAEKEEPTEYEKYRDMLWTAPELLRMPHKPYYGTQKGDVFSFAIILQEIVYRALPYFMSTQAPKDVIQRVARGVDPPFRPRLQELTDDTNSDILDLMIICWYEDPNDRPDFELCRKKILAINGGKKIDVMSNILDKLEKYAGNLEDIVNQRAGELVEEKKKTDLLLYSMMPQSVAEQLKTGKRVEAKLYDQATVFFSDVVGFTALSSESTPMQVVDFLNDLYTLFDDIINRHDVYKVETIGDAYMVVSGVPNPNGGRHIAEIANMALELVSALFTEFRVRHRPGMQIKLRTGMHSGPCASGVVGTSMPRYCLFGDTVSTASAMEASGEAMKIHMSEESYAAIKKIGSYRTTQRGEVQVKGIGTRTTHWLLGRDGFMKPLPPFNSDK